MKPGKPHSLPENSAKVFGKVYADYYDLFYRDKDYKAECDMIEEVFRRYGKNPIKTILDLGCGTGNHSILLAQRGYEVTGVDISSDMLAHAQSKVNAMLSAPCPMPKFLQGDVRFLDLGETFDAVIMMFAVLSYQTTNDDILAALRTVRHHLQPGGLFVADVWYGLAVLKIRPEERTKEIDTDEGKIIRKASGSLDVYHHLAEVKYSVIHIKDNSVLSEDEEVHKMRYFFPPELAFFTSKANLKLLDLCAFDGLDKTPTEDTWNVLAIAKCDTIV